LQLSSPRELNTREAHSRTEIGCWEVAIVRHPDKEINRVLE
jgi:hypothetical protein